MGFEPHMTLPAEWRRWRSNRRRELVDQGLSLSTAALLAARETKGRRRIAETVGTVAAMAAELAVTDGPEPRFAIVGDWDLVPPEQHKAVESMMAHSGQSKH